MALAKFEKLGTIFSRVNGLIRGGALSYEDRPLWYDIYEKFSPRSVNQKADLPNLIYPEDYVRAYFYDNIGQNGIIDLLNPTPTICQKYVDVYCKLLNKNDINESDIFEKAKDYLHNEGLLKDKKLFFKNIN